MSNLPPHGHSLDKVGEIRSNSREIDPVLKVCLNVGILHRRWINAWFVSKNMG
jgi:hypothetical protein